MNTTTTAVMEFWQSMRLSLAFQRLLISKNAVCCFGLYSHKCKALFALAQTKINVIATEGTILGGCNFNAIRPMREDLSFGVPHQKGWHALKIDLQH